MLDRNGCSIASRNLNALVNCPSLVLLCIFCSTKNTSQTGYSGVMICVLDVNLKQQLNTAGVKIKAWWQVDGGWEFSLDKLEISMLNVYLVQRQGKAWLD